MAKAAPSDVQRLVDLAKMSGGNRALARAITRGGFLTLDEGTRAVVRDAARYVNSEGPFEIEAVSFKTRKRSWALHLTEDGRYMPIVTGPPGRLRNVEPRQIRQWLAEAKAALKPVLARFRRSTMKNASLAWSSALKAEPVVSQRLTSAQLVIDVRARLSLDALASQLVVAEHPEAGKASWVLRRAKSARSR